MCSLFSDVYTELNTLNLLGLHHIVVVTITTGMEVSKGVFIGIETLRARLVQR